MKWMDERHRHEGLLRWLEMRELERKREARRANEKRERKKEKGDKARHSGRREEEGK